MEYVWKHGAAAITTLKTTRPLEVGKVLVDLFNGEKHRVSSITKETERAFPERIPEDAFQTMLVGKCTEEELAQLREKAGYALTEECRPYLDIVFS
jgi:hypothetical protein